MLEISSLRDLPQDFAQVAVAIGKFDGIHIGHRQLIHELVEYCQEANLVPAVVSFDRHPNLTLRPEEVPGELLTPARKAQILESLGVEVLVNLPFDADMASRSALEFASAELSRGVQMVFVGEGFRFGSGGAGSIEDLRTFGPQLGFRVKEVTPVQIGNRVVSSTLIRELIQTGKVSAAALLLGRDHEIVGMIEHGRKLGRTIGFPTANFSRSSIGLLPQDGVYAGWLIADGVRYPAAHSVGTNDSVGEVPRLIESHVIGRDDLDLYDKECTALIHAQIRPWAKFESLDALIAQINDDVLAAREILESIDA